MENVKVEKNLNLSQIAENVLNNFDEIIGKYSSKFSVVLYKGNGGTQSKNGWFEIPFILQIIWSNGAQFEMRSDHNLMHFYEMLSRLEDILQRATLVNPKVMDKFEIHDFIYKGL